MTAQSTVGIASEPVQVDGEHDIEAESDRVRVLRIESPESGQRSRRVRTP